MSEQEQKRNIIQVTDAEIVDVVPSFAITLHEAAIRLKQFRGFVATQMVEGEDYGRIPGVAKPSLWKPGAEKLCNIHGFAPLIGDGPIRQVEDWEKGFFFYVYRCDIVSLRTGQIVAQCIGSCNSLEEQYRWRYEDHTCPKCGQTTIRPSKEEYGGGWFCWKKLGGCGARFPPGDESIEGQKLGKIPNPDPYSLVNSIDKKAQKRAIVGATLIACRASGIFAQDIEDMPNVEQQNGVSPETSTSTKNGKHWIESPNVRTRFWARMNEMGLSHDEVHEALDVESVKDFTGTMQEALDHILAAAAMRQYVEWQTQEGNHS